MNMFMLLDRSQYFISFLYPQEQWKIGQLNCKGSHFNLGCCPVSVSKLRLLGLVKITECYRRFPSELFHTLVVWDSILQTPWFKVPYEPFLCFWKSKICILVSNLQINHYTTGVVWTCCQKSRPKAGLFAVFALNKESIRNESNPSFLIKCCRQLSQRLNSWVAW